MNKLHITTDLACLLQRYFSTYLINQRKVSAHTVAAYRDTFRLLLPFIADQLQTSVASLTLLDLNHEGILAFLHYLEEKRNVCERTRNARLAAIRSFLREKTPK